MHDHGVQRGICSKCGVEAGVGRGLLQPLGKGAELFCPPCRNPLPKLNRMQRRTLLVGLGVIVALWFLLSPAAVLRGVFALATAAGLSVFVHEAGHAVVGLFASRNVTTVVLGVGPTVRTPLGGVVFRFGPLPFGGGVLPPGHKGAGLRDRQMAVTLGGPLATMALLFFVWWWSPASEYHQALDHRLGLLQLLILLVNLVPFRFRARGRDFMSDAYRVLQIVNAKPGELEGEIDAAAYDEAFEAGKAGIAPYPDADAAAEAKLGWAIGRVQNGGFEAGAARLREVLAAPQGLAAERVAEAFATLAWAEVSSGKPELRAPALAHADAAYGLMPWAAVAQRARGAALVATGRAAEGLPLLQRGGAKLRGSAKGETLSWTALGQLELGRWQDAELALNDARKLRATGWVRVQLEKQITARAAAADLLAR
ncbi:MAG: M50 family metallopeptidase [Acidimicrobiales bacterium]